MGLFSRKTGLMDVVECNEKDYLIWKWRPENDVSGSCIRWGSSLIVREGSSAVLSIVTPDGLRYMTYDGPYQEILETANIPVLSGLINNVYGGKSPFQAEVYFINRAYTVQSRFGVPYFDVFDPKHPEFSIPVAVRGSFEFNIQDCQLFIQKHGLGNLSQSDLMRRVRDSFAQTVKTIVKNVPEKYNIPVVQIENRISDIGDELQQVITPVLFEQYGITLTSVSVAAVEINKESKDYLELKAITKDQTAEDVKVNREVQRQDVKANQKLGVLNRAANIIVDTKESQFARHLQTKREYSEETEQELAGHIGAAGAKIINAIGNVKDRAAKTIASAGAKDAPPPVPTAVYHIARAGKDTGSYDFTALQKMAADGTLTSETLVWKKGMLEWKQAGTVDELSSILRQESEVPPVPEE